MKFIDLSPATDNVSKKPSLQADKRPVSAIADIVNSFESPDYQTVVTNKAAESFSVVNSNNRATPESFSIDELDGSVTIVYDDSTLIFQSLTQYERFRNPLVARLFWAGLKKIQDQNPFRQIESIHNVKYIARISLKEYLDLLGKSDEKELRKVLKNRVFPGITNIRASWDERRKGQKTPENFGVMGLVTDAQVSNGVIEISFNPKFIFALLKTGFLLDIPRIYFCTNLKTNPYSSQLCLTIVKFRHMNTGKKNQNIIPFLSLIHGCGIDIEKATAQNRALRQRVIEPIERDLDALSPFLTWEYCHRDGSALSDEELSASKTTKEFLNALAVRFSIRQESPRMIADWKKH